MNWGRPVPQQSWQQRNAYNGPTAATRSVVPWQAYGATAYPTAYRPTAMTYRQPTRQTAYPAVAGLNSRMNTFPKMAVANRTTDAAMQQLSQAMNAGDTAQLNTAGGGIPSELMQGLQPSELTPEMIASLQAQSSPMAMFDPMNGAPGRYYAYAAAAGLASSAGLQKLVATGANGKSYDLLLKAASKLDNLPFVNEASKFLDRQLVSAGNYAESKGYKPLMSVLGRLSPKESEHMLARKSLEPVLKYGNLPKAVESRIQQALNQKTLTLRDAQHAVRGCFKSA